MSKTIENISRLPENTWNWLGINSTSLALAPAEQPYKGNPVQVQPTGMLVQSELPPLKVEAQPFILRDTAAFVAENSNHALQIIIEEGYEISEPMVLHYTLQQGSNLTNRVHIEAGAGSKATILICYDGQAGDACQHNSYATVTANPDAELTLVQVQMLPANATHFDGVSVDVKENANVQLVLAEMGSAQVVAGCNVQLSQQSAKTDLQSLYLAGGTARRDLNYRIEFGKPETEGKIHVHGALTGSAVKTLKSTVDFISGSHDSKGREEESVLVLSDKVRNMSTPLLLCGEDNVEGEHATNIGRPDPNKLYYLMSRGFTEKQAKILMVEASFTPVLDKVPLEDLREKMAALVREVTQA